MFSSSVRLQTRRRVAILLSTVFLASLAWAFSSTAAVASSSVQDNAVTGNAASAVGYYSAGGRSYQNWSVVRTSSFKADATTLTAFTSGLTTAGYAGSRGRLFTSGGSLSCEGVNSYNTQDLAAVGYSCIRKTSGAWYSYGVSYAWNGSGYNAFYTFKSPNQNS
jgi:hypothetical protein